MSDNLRDRIAAVQRQHMWGTAQKCMCGGHREPSTHPDHVADAVIAELKPYESDEYIDFDDGHAGGYPHHHRVVVIDMGVIK
jgi:hypothetical protein